MTGGDNRGRTRLCSKSYFGSESRGFTGTVKNPTFSFLRTLDIGAWDRSGGFFALDPGRCVLGQFRSAFQVQFLLNLLAIIFDGLDAQVKFVGDVARLLPPADKLKDLHFTIAQPAHRRFADVRLPTDLALQHFGCQRVTYV